MRESPAVQQAFGAIAHEYEPTSFIGVPGVHVQGSAHYAKKAVDVVPKGFAPTYNRQAWDALAKLVLSGRFVKIGAAKELVDGLGSWARQHGVELFVDDPRYDPGTTGFHFHLQVP